MAVEIPAMPSPCEEALAALSKSLGQELPPSYLAFVSRHDGARPEENSFNTSDNEVGVARFIPAAEAVSLSRQIDGFPARVILFAEDDCGNYFYVKPSTGSVHFWDHERDEGDEQVAVDAAAFAEKLRPFDPTTVQLARGQVKRVWIDPSFKPEF